ncbi:MAG: hypothetical protein EOP47_21795 [Sphingobacteriaceae bacterium]|nr:MAG: hypothetical protein EOP47_21795 [Sphingobacteriaceae bacterium]
MKKISLSAMCVAVALASCSSNQNKVVDDSAATDSTHIMHNENAASGHACFLHTDGTANQDSTIVYLMVSGSKVTGEMKWLPKEKDSRNGTLEGTQEGNTIKAVWSFMQEGMTDTMAVEFDYSGDKLSQKPFIVNQATGRQQTDTNASHSIAFNKVDCK